MRIDLLRTVALLVALGLAACDAVTSPFAVADGRGSDRCVNVAHTGQADLGFPVIIPPPPGTVDPIVGAGALPAPATLGTFEGLLSSVLTSERQRGSGAVHYTLAHYFEGADGAFWTSDAAVCAPSGGGPLTCRVNDVLTVIAGTGVFANAGGSLRNHGVITITDPQGNPFGSLTVDIRGRLCGDGI